MTRAPAIDTSGRPHGAPSRVRATVEGLVGGVPPQTRPGVVVRFDVRRQHGNGHAPRRAGGPGAMSSLVAADACRDAIAPAAAA